MEGGDGRGVKEGGVEELVERGEGRGGKEGGREGRISGERGERERGKD